MAQDFRNNLQRNVGTSEVTLVTGGDYDAVIGIRCCNVTTSTIEVDVFIDNSGNDHFIAKALSHAYPQGSQTLKKENIQLLLVPHEPNATMIKLITEKLKFSKY